MSKVADRPNARAASSRRVAAASTPAAAAPSGGAIAALQVHAVHDVPSRGTTRPRPAHHLAATVHLNGEQEIEISVAHCEDAGLNYDALKLNVRDAAELDDVVGLLAWCRTQIPGMLAAQQAVAPSA